MGSDSDPASLHRYLYASGDPVNRMDPGGREDFSLTGVLASTSAAETLGGILDGADLMIKDQFAAAAGVDISQEKVIAQTIVCSAGLSNGWTPALEQSIQALELALSLYHIVKSAVGLVQSIKRINAEPPFSKFANALSKDDNALSELGNEADNIDEMPSAENDAVASGSPGCKRNLCLVAGSLIEMADGTTKPIETLQPNDLVVSRDPETGKTEPERVTQTISRKSAVLVTLIFTDPKTGSVTDKMVCTPEHPIYVQGQGWVPAGMLTKDDLVATRNGDLLKVTSILWQRDEKHGFTVYNLTIEDDHTYFTGVADGGIWVHNYGCANGGMYPEDELGDVKPPGDTKYDHDGLRRNMLEKGNPPDPDRIQAHHELPWKFKDWFAERGFNVNDDRYGKWVGASHQSWSRQYEEAWEGFKDGNPLATKAEVEAFLGQLRADIAYH